MVTGTASPSRLAWPPRAPWGICQGEEKKAVDLAISIPAEVALTNAALVVMNRGPEHRIDLAVESVAAVVEYLPSIS